MLTISKKIIVGKWEGIYYVISLDLMFTYPLYTSIYKVTSPRLTLYVARLEAGGDVTLDLTEGLLVAGALTGVAACPRRAGHAVAALRAALAPYTCACRNQQAHPYHYIHTPL